MYHDDNLENCSNIEDGVIIKLLDMKIPQEFLIYDLFFM